MKHDTIVELLQKTNLFSSLDVSELEELSKIARISNYDQNDTLFTQFEVLYTIITRDILEILNLD